MDGLLLLSRADPTSRSGPNGACVVGSGANCSGVPASVELEQLLSNGQPLSYVARSQVSLATDNANNVVATWWEGPAFGQEQVVAKRCNNSLSSCTFIDAQCKRCLGGSNNQLQCTTDANCPGGFCQVRVFCPPAAPSGAQRGKTSSVATDAPGPTAPGNLLIGWQGNANDPSSSPVWTGFGRGFDSALAGLKKDFRLDLGGRSNVTSPRAARSPFTQSYTMAWNDKRTATPHVYTRVVGSAP